MLIFVRQTSVSQILPALSDQQDIARQVCTTAVEMNLFLCTINEKALHHDQYFTGSWATYGGASLLGCRDRDTGEGTW
jgi:hypothetical protein